MLPQIKRSNGNTQEWNTFQNMLNNEQIQLNQLQHYVDHLNPIFIPKYQKKVFSRQSQQTSFKPSKTFGGQKYKPNLGGKIQQQQNEVKQYARTSLNNESYHTKIQNNPKILLPALQRVNRIFTQGHMKLIGLLDYKQDRQEEKKQSNQKIKQLRNGKIQIIDRKGKQYY